MLKIILLPIKDIHLKYTKIIESKLKKDNYRTEINNSDEKISYKIRQASIEKIPYMIVIGDKEIETKQLSIRNRDTNALVTQTINQFCTYLKTITQ